MRKAHSIALAVVVALLAAAPAQAASPSPHDPTVGKIVAQEQVLLGSQQNAGKSTVDRLVRQEEGRGGDPRLFASAGSAPVLVVGPSQGFDVGDAAVGEQRPSRSRSWRRRPSAWAAAARPARRRSR
jgi:hypothetical protein